ncbi:F-box domain-containing protein [Mycena venus]|uniref:F-box domain-containing protein n=1 Tax=Mycena venus TaxID=2733690 RepID=A0A8H6YWN7_9AGAR|nr:F-box domain-containing protein [Mycena venus]
MLLHLPTEILEEISQLVALQFRGWDMRLSCKALCDAADLAFYGLFVVSDRALIYRQPEKLRILEDIVRGESKWTRYARVVRILTSGTQIPAEERAYSELLSAAIKSMRNVRAVTLMVAGADVQWVREAVQRALSELPLLAELDIVLRRKIQMHIAGISGLKRLRLHALGERDSLGNQVAQIVAQSPQLTSLQLLGQVDYSAVGPILTSPKCRGVYLKQLMINTVTNTLLVYLKSYSGLEQLALVGGDGSREASDRLADDFFQSVLLRHANTLVDLKVTARHEGRWSFGTHNIDSLLNLHQLKSLGVSVNGEDVLERGDGIQRKLKAKTTGNAIHLLLDNVHHFPALETVVICFAPSEGNGIGRIQHGPRMLQIITSSVEAFRTEIASSVRVMGTYKQVAVSDEAVDTESSVPRQLFAYQRPPTSHLVSMLSVY